MFMLFSIRIFVLNSYLHSCKMFSSTSTCNVFSFKVTVTSLHISSSIHMPCMYLIVLPTVCYLLRERFMHDLTSVNVSINVLCEQWFIGLVSAVNV